MARATSVFAPRTAKINPQGMRSTLLPSNLSQFRDEEVT